MTTSEIVADALRKIGRLGIGATASGEDATYVLFTLNSLLDLWNAKRHAVYGESKQSFTLTPSLQPHTIGPSSATVSATIRPVSIAAALLEVSDHRYPIAIRTREWYSNLSTPELTSTHPTDLYYEPGWPNGSLYFWPVPTSAYSVDLWKRILLASLALTDSFTLPPGYQAAITGTLCEMIAPTYGWQITAEQQREFRDARATIFGNNDVTPEYIADGGLPGSRSGGWYDYQTGRIR